MSDERDRAGMSRRELLGTMGRAAVATIALPPFLTEPGGRSGAFPGARAGASVTAAPLAAAAGPDRVVVQPGRTWINAWAGYGEPPTRQRPRRGEAEPAAEAAPSGPEPTVTWRKVSGPGEVAFADPNALVTTASFGATGAYEIALVAATGDEEVTSTFQVTVESPPPAEPLQPIPAGRYRLHDGLWRDRIRALTVSWIPHCIDMIERDDLEVGQGGLDNFVEAAKALRGEPHGEHKGYVFSNAWVYQTIESMSLALMVDPEGDAEILAAHERMRDTIEAWIPVILAAREPDGYLQTAYTLRDRAEWPARWTAEGRRNHEGYVAGYFLEAALVHHTMTEGRDTRLYDAAKRLADTWYEHIGPPPKQPWYDGHQAMEMALVRFGHYVSQVEGGRRGDRYLDLAKFLLDCRGGGYEYDQSHLPVVQQYEAVGHAVRAVYSYAAMADVALETGDVDYQSAVRSLCDSIVHKKYYVTGGVGSGETSEGFGPEYSLRNNGYCESCSSCGEIFFQSKLNRTYKDARYADLLEETLYNALLGSTNLDATHYYYDNPLDTRVPRYAWHNVPCCVGNIPRTLLMLPAWTYARGADGLYVNLFVGSTVTIDDVAGTAVEVVQETRYPWEGAVAITVNPRESSTFSVRVRVPDRMVSRLYTATPEAGGLASLRVNGTSVDPAIERGYAVITRRWQAGDRIEIELPLPVQRVRGDERIEATRGKVALKAGPLVYTIERDDQDIEQALASESPLATEWRGDFLGGVSVVTGAFANGSPLLAIPNYARSNRMEGTPVPQRRDRLPDGSRPEPPPVTSVVWITEA